MGATSGAGPEPGADGRERVSDHASKARSPVGHDLDHHGYGGGGHEARKDIDLRAAVTRER